MNNSSLPTRVINVDKWISNIHEYAVQHGHEITVDYTPKLEMEFESEEAAHTFYNMYAQRMGFGIRRDYLNRIKKDGVLTPRRFSCCKKGERGHDK